MAVDRDSFVDKERIEHRDDVRMAEVREHPRFAQEPLRVLHDEQRQVGLLLHVGQVDQALINENFRRAGGDAIHFTGVYSLSRADVERIGDQVLKLLDSIQDIVAPSKEEDVACLCLDWFVS